MASSSPTMTYPAATAKALTDELSLTAQDIVNASHRLQKEFAKHAQEIEASNDSDNGELRYEFCTFLIRALSS